MWNWNPFKKKEILKDEDYDDAFLAEPKSHEFPVVEHQLKKPIVVGTWRTGMWVIYNEQIAVLHKIVDYSGEVHTVDPETGHTVKEQLVPLDALRQAKYYDIPACRRKHFDREVARSLGYGD